jgi:hypothetical protein
LEHSTETLFVSCFRTSVKSKLNSGGAYCYSVQKVLSSCVLSNHLKIKIHKTINYLLQCFCFSIFKRRLILGFETNNCWRMSAKWWDSVLFIIPFVNRYFILIFLQLLF